MRGIYIGLMGLLLIPALAQEGLIETRRNTHTIVVNGSGEASAPPDQAVVRLGATSQNAQADVAQAKVNEVLQKALDAIEKAGVPKKSIRTARLTLAPVYSQERTISSAAEGPKVIGFRASNTIEVTLEDLKLVGKVIDAGIAVGANELQGVSFSLKNDLAQRSNALTLAAQEAQSKAQTIAKALNLNLGGVVEVTEGGVHVIPFNEGFTGGARMMATKSMATPIEPGEVRVQADVTVRYEIASPARR